MKQIAKKSFEKLRKIKKQQQRYFKVKLGEIPLEVHAAPTSKSIKIEYDDNVVRITSKNMETATKVIKLDGRDLTKNTKIESQKNLYSELAQKAMLEKSQLTISQIRNVGDKLRRSNTTQAFNQSIYQAQRTNTPDDKPGVD